MSKKKKSGRSSLSESAAILGAAGGKIGGPARSRALSSEEKSAIASKAAKARWTKAGMKHRKKSQQIHENPDGKKPD